MNNASLLKLSKVTVFSLFLFANTAKAAPIPPGATYEISAKILAVNEASKETLFDAQANSKIISMPIEIEIISVGSMIRAGKSLESNQRDNYKTGQKIKVFAQIKESDLQADKSIIRVGANIKGSIYSHGDEKGDWYILNLDTNK